MSTEVRRYGVHDCVYELHLDLYRAACTLPLTDADARTAWLDAAVDLLSWVRDESQRVSWAWALAGAFCRSGTAAPWGMILQELWTRAEVKYPCE